MGVLRLTSGRPSVAVPPAAASLAISGSPGATGTVGSVYSFTPAAAGGVAPYRFVLTGTLPAGLSFNTTTGAITGTFTGAETRAGLSITALDARGYNSPPLATFSITVTGGVSSGRGNFGSVRPSGALDADPAPSGPTNWYNVVVGAAPGSVVYLAPGTYDFDFSAINKTAPGVTIMGQTGVNAPLIKMTNCSGLTFSYIDVTSGNPATDSGGHPLIAFAALAQSCQRIGFDHLTITNDLGPVNLVVDTDGNNGAHQGAGIACNNSDDVRVTNNLISKRQTGIAWYNVRGGTTDLAVAPNLIENNSITHANVDLIILNGVSNYVLRGNWESILDEPLPTGAHPDSMQVSNTVSPPVRNLNGLIELNRVDNPTGRSDMQGIILGESCDDLIVRYNCCFGVQTTGMSMSNFNRCQMYDNFYDGWVDAPRVNVRSGSDTISVLRNKASGGFVDTPFNPITGELANTNVTMPTTGPDANVTITQATGPTDTVNRDAFLAAMTAAGHILAVA